MPYEIRGKCIYRKDTGVKVGCTKGDVHKYMAALHANVVNEEESLNEVRMFVRKTLMEETKKKEEKVIHLPELSMNKKDLIKYLKDLYNIELK